MSSAVVNAGAPHHFPLRGSPFTNGLGGVLSDGLGNVLETPRSDAAAVRRTGNALRAASTDGLPRVPRLFGVKHLPAGVHAATWGEFATRFGGSPRRLELLTNFRSALDALHGAGISSVVVGGSFTSSKRAPGDIDVAAVLRPGVNHHDVFAKVPAELTHHDGISLFPAHRSVSNAPQLSNHLPGETFLEFFSKNRTGRSVGTVLLDTSPLAAGARGKVGRLAVVEHAVEAIRTLAPKVLRA